MSVLETRPAPRSALRSALLLIAASAAPCATFLLLTLPRLRLGSVIGTGQDEWYNVVRSLRALYNAFNPTYFIHPALYYELMALLYAGQRALLTWSGAVEGRQDFLDLFLVNQAAFLDPARYATVAFGALAVIAAVWLGGLLAGFGGGLLAGMVIATLPLLQASASMIRVDTLGLATMLGATAMIVRAHDDPRRRAQLGAAIAIGVAAAANYPGALLLVLLAWSAWVRRSTAEPSAEVGLLHAAAVGFGVFLLLNPYVVLDLRQFLAWFFFQAEVPFLKHPHAQEASATKYAELLWAQGWPAVLAGAAAVAALSAPRRPAGALAAFGIVYLTAFSLMRSQYDRFALPGIAMLCVGGTAWLCAQLARIRPWVTIVIALAAAPLVVWSALTLAAKEAPFEPGEDYRAAMFAWIEEHVPSDATLIIESDTMPLLQTVYDPGVVGKPFDTTLRAAFEARHPHLVRKVMKSQFIAAVYNYDPALLDGERVYFLASSQNREFIAFNREVLPQPSAFYDALDARATMVHEAGGFREKLQLYEVR